MEYRNNNFTPRDRLDERFIRELLDLEFDNRSDTKRSCTGELRSNSSDNKYQTVNSTVDNDSGSYAGRQRNACEQSDDSSCGCGKNRTRETREFKDDNNCSRRNERNVRRNSDKGSSVYGKNGNREVRGQCGDRSERDYQNGSCGCGYRDNNRREARAEIITDCVNNDGYQRDDFCGCCECDGFSVPMLRGVPLSMVYSPYQEWGNLYEPEIGHSKGTIFKCLEFPFYPTPCNRGSSSCGCSDYNRKK